MLLNPRITVATVVPVRGKYIIIEESVEGQAVLNQPAGHVEEEEDFAGAAQRETLEESGWAVEVQYLIGAYRLRVPEFNFIRFCFAATALEQLHPEAPDKNIAAVHYLDHNQLMQLPGERLRSPLVVRCIEDYENGHRIALHRLQYLKSL